MIINTPFKVDSDLYRKCIENATHLTGKITLNKPTNRFFYDPWEIKEEYRNTIWEDVLNTLPKQIGEARLLTLESGKCYFGHADIDDRYHLTLTGKKSFLVDLEKDQMHSLENDGKWYDMNAGLIHSAVNFGDVPRIQLVVRKLLNDLSNYPSTKILITLNTNIHDSRYYFDQEISPMLNQGNKSEIIHSFNVDANKVSFNIHNDFVETIVSKSCERCNIIAI
jgi:hypothetical protein